MHMTDLSHAWCKRVSPLCAPMIEIAETFSRVDAVHRISAAPFGESYPRIASKSRRIGKSFNNMPQMMHSGMSVLAL